MKQYLLSVHMVEGQPPPAPEEIEPRYDSVEDFNRELQDKGAWVAWPLDFKTKWRPLSDLSTIGLAWMKEACGERH